MNSRAEQGYWVSFGVYAVVVLAVVFLPIFYGYGSLAIVAGTGKRSTVFELFGLFAALAVIADAVVQVRKTRAWALDAHLPVFLTLLVRLHFLFLLTEFSSRSWDYGCYEKAVSALLEGRNPYESCYLYPPLLAQVMAWTFRWIHFAAIQLSGDPGAAPAWELLFYFYQCVQYLLVVLAFHLTSRFALRLGFTGSVAFGLAAALFLLNNPLVRTLKFNQVNLWVLNAFLLALLYSRQSPWWSGLAAAIGGHLKLYPLALIVPWGLTKQWRPIFSALAFTVGIAFLHNDLGRNWSCWSQYLDLLREFPRGTELRDNSLSSLVYNCLSVSGAALGLESGAMDRWVNPVVAVLVALTLGWFAVRFYRRERAFRSVGAESDLLLERRFQGHCVDIMALSLLVSPFVWEHHYILSVPIILWSLAMVDSRQRWKTVVAALLMLGMPTFNVFPLSYHRIAGLVFLLASTSPKAGAPKQA